MLGETRSDVLTSIQSDTLEIEHNTPPEDLTIGQKLRYSQERKKTQHEEKIHHRAIKKKRVVTGKKKLQESKNKKKYINIYKSKILREKEQKQWGLETPVRRQCAQVRKINTEHQ